MTVLTMPKWETERKACKHVPLFLEGEYALKNHCFEAPAKQLQALPSVVLFPPYQLSPSHSFALFLAYVFFIVSLHASPIIPNLSHRAQVCDGQW